MRVLAYQIIGIILGCDNVTPLRAFQLSSRLYDSIQLNERNEYPICYWHEGIRADIKSILPCEAID